MRYAQWGLHGVYVIPRILMQILVAKESLDGFNRGAMIQHSYGKHNSSFSDESIFVGQEE